MPGGEYKPSGRSIQRWEVGKTQPQADVVPVIAKALGVSVAYINGEDASGEDDEEAALHSALVDLSDALLAVLRTRGVPDGTVAGAGTRPEAKVGHQSPGPRPQNGPTRRESHA